MSIPGEVYLIWANKDANPWNREVSFNSRESSFIGPAWNSAGNTFNGNITVNSTGSSTGIQFCNASTATATLAAGYAIQTAAAGFTPINLFPKKVSTLGHTPHNPNLHRRPHPSPTC